MQLETARLILRKPKTTDVDDYMEFVNSQFVQQYNAMTPATREKVEAEFANAKDDLSVLVLASKTTNKIIGIVYTQDDSIRYEVNSKEISYFLREDESRKGYMKEALSAFLSHLFASEALECICARAFSDNTASRALLKSLGFQENGIIPRCVKGYGDIIFDDVIHTLFPDNLK